MHVLLKIGGSEMCDILSEVPRCVTKCDRGRESKLVQNSVTYFQQDATVGCITVGVQNNSEARLIEGQ